MGQSHYSTQEDTDVAKAIREKIKFIFLTADSGFWIGWLETVRNMIYV